MATDAKEHSSTSTGSVVVSETVGMGIAYDLLTHVLASVVLSGRLGDPVSLAVFTGYAQKDVPGAVIVLSAATYEVDGERADAPDRSGSGNVLVFAQFN